MHVHLSAVDFQYISLRKIRRKSHMINNTNIVSKPAKTLKQHNAIEQNDARTKMPLVQ